MKISVTKIRFQKSIWSFHFFWGVKSEIYFLTLEKLKKDDFRPCQSQNYFFVKKSPSNFMVSFLDG